jgi:hypothetical protein
MSVDALAMSDAEMVILIETMRLHVHDASFLPAPLLSLGHFCHADPSSYYRDSSAPTSMDKDRQSRVVAVGGLTLLHQVMNAHPSDADAQHAALYALGSVVCENYEIMGVVDAEGLIQDAVDAMMRHVGTEAVQGWGCYALGNIAVNFSAKQFHVANQSAIVDAGSCHV